jgi:hypothetical protein
VAICNICFKNSASCNGLQNQAKINRKTTNGVLKEPLQTLSAAAAHITHSKYLANSGTQYKDIYADVLPGYNIIHGEPESGPDSKSAYTLKRCTTSNQYGAYNSSHPIFSPVEAEQRGNKIENYHCDDHEGQMTPM